MTYKEMYDECVKFGLAETALKQMTKTHLEQIYERVKRLQARGRTEC